MNFCEHFFASIVRRYEVERNIQIGLHGDEIGHPHQPGITQVFFQRILQPLAAEPESWKKARQAFAPRATVEGGVGVLEISGVLAYRPDLGSLFFDGFEDSAEVLSAFRRLEADPATQAIG